MLVSVKLHVDTLEYRPSLRLYRGTVNSSQARNSQPRCEGNLTDRGEDEFYCNSNTIDTHNPNTQGGLKPCMCM
jgi:hypothetical protein